MLRMKMHPCLPRGRPANFKLGTWITMTRITDTLGNVRGRKFEFNQLSPFRVNLAKRYTYKDTQSRSASA